MALLVEQEQQMVKQEQQGEAGGVERHGVWRGGCGLVPVSRCDEADVLYWSPLPLQREARSPRTSSHGQKGPAYVRAKRAIQKYTSTPGLLLVMQI